MGQSELIKDIAKYGLENNRESLHAALNELIEHSKQHRKVNFAIQLQSILKDSIQIQQTNGLSIVGSLKHHIQVEEREINEFILEKLTSDYNLNDLVCETPTKKKLDFFIKEHTNISILRKNNLPVSNKLLLHGPSGCGKTLAAYSLAGELKKILFVIDLGSIVSSKLGETSKNLSKIFKKASTENCIIFLDEFDSLGKIRDYSQDHGEMKRVVNTLLQLFDYLPQETILIAATNQKEMIDNALLRRFDLSIELEKPTIFQIKELVSKTLENSNFYISNKNEFNKCLNEAIGLSYYSIQKTLITAIKQSILNTSKVLKYKIKISCWVDLLKEEKKYLHN